jgi:CHAT domain-containing protein
VELICGKSRPLETVEGGEGIYGLRRALVLAGAESQVVSLWKVADAATRDLMVAHYRQLLAGEGRAEALRQAQLEIIAGTRTGSGTISISPSARRSSSTVGRIGRSMVRIDGK